ncbi:thioredoxin domain-containing protein [Streptomyces sp. JJ36]|uniref:DsbA family protein n=1 Tax=Streptomyces sp. JJ36 TaxID=2736645 RepID=UPI001F33845C|nr:thioredoxin domain-containing protein [Streptomyces sp. JJ36]MCF6521569.1 thioredoxin domain-containing protein [Streptomyces sp. JJ36]
MSDDSRPGVPSARERLRVERERDRQRAKRLRALKVTGGAVLVLGVAALVGVAVAVTGKGGSESTDAQPVSTGASDAPVTMTVYEDFRCPACAQFEKQFRGTVNELRDAGKLRVDYHLVTIIDGNLGGQGSARAAGAAMCAHDENAFVPYHDVLYANQPPEQNDAFASKDRLLKLAREVPGLRTVQFEKCVRDELKRGRVERTNAAFLDSGYNATPTVLIDGKNVYGDQNDPFTPQELRKLVERKAGNTSG